MSFMFAAGLSCGTVPIDGWRGDLWNMVDTIQAAKKEARIAPTPELKAVADRKVSEGLGRMEQLGDARKDDAQAQTRVARAFLDVGEPRRALARADRAVSLAPGDAAARLARAQASYRLGRYKAVAEDARAALRLEPGSAEALSLLKLTERRSGRSAPAMGEARAKLSVTQKEAGSARPPAGAQAADLRAAADRRKAAGLLLEAEQRARLGDFAASLRSAARAAEVDPGNARAYLQRAVARLGLKDHAGASRDADKALELDPGLASAYLGRARAGEGMGRSAESVLADYRRAAELDPRYSVHYEEALERYGGGKAPGAGEFAGQSGTSGSRRGLEAGAGGSGQMAGRIAGLVRRPRRLLIPAALLAVCLAAACRRLLK